MWETKLNKYNNILERCMCECWKETWVTHHNLVKQRIRSCWCLLADTAREKQKKYCTKHWLRTNNNRFSRIYQDMRRRCKNPHDKAYPMYWWRWIKIERNNIEEFWNDMGASYEEHVKQYWEENTSIDRINNDGNYCKENCRWATRTKQQNNRRNNLRITLDGVEYTTKEFWEKYNLKRRTADYRIRKYLKWEMSYETLTHVWICRKTLPPKEEDEWKENETTEL